MHRLGVGKVLRATIHTLVATKGLIVAAQYGLVAVHCMRMRVLSAC